MPDKFDPTSVCPDCPFIPGRACREPSHQVELIYCEDPSVLYWRGCTRPAPKGLRCDLAGLSTESFWVPVWVK